MGIPFFSSMAKVSRALWPMARTTAHAAHPAAFDHKLRYPGRKAHLSAPGKDLLPHVLHHPGQHVRSHMRSAFIPDLLRCAIFHEDLQDLGIPAVPVLYQRVQLAIGKGARTSFSELHVGIRVERSRFPELFHPPGTALHILSPFQKQRPVSRPRQQISAEKPRRARADNEGPFVQDFLSRLRKMIAHLGRRPHIRIFPAGGKNFLFPSSLQLNINRIDQPDLRLLSGIYGLPDHPQRNDFLRPDVQGARHLFC